MGIARPNPRARCGSHDSWGQNPWDPPFMLQANGPSNLRATRTLVRNEQESKRFRGRVTKCRRWWRNVRPSPVPRGAQRGRHAGLALPRSCVGQLGPLYVCGCRGGAGVAPSALCQMAVEPKMCAPGRVSCDWKLDDGAYVPGHPLRHLFVRGSVSVGPTVTGGKHGMYGYVHAWLGVRMKLCT